MKIAQARPSLLSVRFFLLLLASLLCLRMILPVQAYTMAYIQTSIDVDTWEILSTVIRENVGWTTKSPEVKRVSETDLAAMRANSSAWGDANIAMIESLAGDVQSRTRATNGGSALGNLGSTVVQNFGFLEEKDRVLSFPTDQTTRNDSTSTDMNCALSVNDALIYGLNQAFHNYCVIHGVQITNSASEFHATMVQFLKSISPSQISGDKLTYPISADRGVEPFSYTWYVEKYKGSGEYVNWFMLVYEAFNNYALEGDEAVTEETVFSATPTQLERVLTSFFGNMLDGLRGILGMWSMDELLFSDGWRQNGYVGGIFPNSWEPVIWALFLFMEIFAAMILLYGLITNVLKKAMSTMNTIARLHAMNQLQDLIVCAVALALLPLILRLLITLSHNFTLMIHEMIPVDAATGEKKKIADMAARYGAGGGTISGIISQFLFFGVQVYFNFFYAVRALSVAILIMISPIMIALISVSESKKQASVQWAKELLANICIQPIQAFCMAAVLLLPASSHGFDNLIALYALIPFTSMLRGLFFGAAGSWSEQVAHSAKQKTTGTLAGAGLAAGGAVVGAAATAAAGKLAASGPSEPAGGNEGGAEQAPEQIERKIDHTGGVHMTNAGVEFANAKGTGMVNRTLALARGMGSDISGAGKAAIHVVRHPIQSGAVGFTMKTGLGAGIAAVGGALSGANIAAPVSGNWVRSGSAVAAGRSLNRRTSSQQPQEKEQPNRVREEQDTKVPITLDGLGRKKVDFSKNGQDCAVQDLDQSTLSGIGISDINDQGKDLEFRTSGDTFQARELEAYADYLQSLTPEQRSDEIERRGISATRDGDGVAVRIDKIQWSNANHGARIFAQTRPDTGVTTMRIQTKEDGAALSFTGGCHFAVNSAQIPSIHRTTISKQRDGHIRAVDKSVQQSCLDRGMTPKAAAKTAARSAEIQRLRSEQGLSRTDAASLSKRAISGAQQMDVLSIPRDSMTKEQTMTMESAVRDGKSCRTPNYYQSAVQPGTEAVFRHPAQEKDDQETSFLAWSECGGAQAPVQVSQSVIGASPYLKPDAISTSQPTQPFAPASSPKSEMPPLPAPEFDQTPAPPRPTAASSTPKQKLVPNQKFERFPSQIRPVPEKPTPPAVVQSPAQAGGIPHSPTPKRSKSNGDPPTLKSGENGDSKSSPQNI